MNCSIMGVSKDSYTLVVPESNWKTKDHNNHFAIVDASWSQKDTNYKVYLRYNESLCSPSLSTLANITNIEFYDGYVIVYSNSFSIPNSNISFIVESDKFEVIKVMENK